MEMVGFWVDFMEEIFKKFWLASQTEQISRYWIVSNFISFSIQ